MSLPLYSYSDLLKYKNTCTPIIPGLLYRGDGVIVAGHSEAGKSLLCLQLAMSLATGLEFVEGFEPLGEFKVCYIPTEGSMGTVKDRSRRFGASFDLDPVSPNFRVLNALNNQFNTDKGYPEIVETFKGLGFHPDVIIIDSLYLSCKGGLTNDEVSSEYCRLLNRLIEEYNCAIVLVHHYAKAHQTMFEGKVERDAKDVKGSTGWSDWATTILRFSADSGGFRKLSVGKDRNDVLDFRESPIRLLLDSTDEFLKFRRIDWNDIGADTQGN